MGSRVGPVPPASLQPRTVPRSVLRRATTICAQEETNSWPCCCVSADTSTHILLNQITFFHPVFYLQSRPVWPGAGLLSAVVRNAFASKRPRDDLGSPFSEVVAEFVTSLKYESVAKAQPWCWEIWFLHMAVLPPSSLWCCLGTTLGPSAIPASPWHHPAHQLSLCQHLLPGATAGGHRE